MEENFKVQSSTRRIIAIMIVSCWLFSILSILSFMILDVIDLEAGIAMLKTFSSISSGFVGIVIGHYFSGSNNN